jgi:conjugal transfer mating pair stabilization protein TraG
MAFGASLSQFANAERQQSLSKLATARNTHAEERSGALAFLDCTSTKQTSAVRSSSDSESSAGYRTGESLQRVDDQSLDARDNPQCFFDG